MTNNEPIEQWRKEFLTSRYSLPSYKESEEEVMWQGFLMAKRSHTSVVLPKGFLMDDPDGMGRGRYLMVESVERALNRAGIKYTIGE